MPRFETSPEILVTVVLVTLALAPALPAQETGAPAAERLMLSGTGYGDEARWQFTVTSGRRAGEAATIPVPSQWEQHGFGSYNYGHDDDKSREQGLYQHRFDVPASWRDRVVDLVFDGVMTDAEAQLNGQPAGPAHRGAFYRFRYDVTDLVHAGAENSLEVTVAKHSADASVNRAERDADYWVFGGIYRPVYLEARPPESIDHVAIDARHDGALTAIVRPRGLTSPARLTAWVETLDGTATGAPFSAEAAPGATTVELRARLDGVRPWSAERPDLYRLVVELHRDGAPPEAGHRGVLYRHTERFGFRTVERRPDGLFVNGRRVLLKGVNRHAFWPASGRTLNHELDRRDAELIKTMNLNAVRASHYPPDVSFLDACDELGLYVINELAGWHDAYSTSIGRRLVREMVERDVNHPSVILWANGNEDGWNTALDDDFAAHDPQRRIVIHPRSLFGGFDTDHYLDWQTLETLFDPDSLKNRWRSLFGELPLVMPTEILHGLYDGGSGAALEDYWNRLRASPRAAGAFLWAFVDEAIERTDRGGALDTDGNHAPDGILGPYRELSGNYYAVRDVFSPIQLAGDERSGGHFNGSVRFENRFEVTDLAGCRFDWQLLDLPAPGGEQVVTLDAGSLPGPAAPPGEIGTLALPPEVDWRSADAVSLTAYDLSDRSLWTWVLPTRDPRRELRSTATAGGEPIRASEDGGNLTLRSASATAAIDLSTGRLLALGGETGLIPVGGPLPVVGFGDTPVAVRHGPRDDGYEVDVRYAGGRSTSRSLTSKRWFFLPSGWLRLSYSYTAEGPKDFFGVRLEVPEAPIETVRWLGDGPARVWKNRRRGGTLGLWRKAAAEVTPVAAAHEPKLAGYYSGVVWAELISADGRLLLAIESPDLDLGLFSPDFPDDARTAVAAVPPGGVTLLHGISAIGTKFKPSDELGPQSRPAVATGPYHGAVWLRAMPR